VVEQVTLIGLIEMPASSRTSEPGAQPLHGVGSALELEACVEVELLAQQHVDRAKALMSCAIVAARR